jgi:hypothetical protein
MANKYVRSTDGNDADNGTTWALAKATVNGATSIASAGDTVYVSQAHAETSASPTSISWTSSTAAAPMNIVCGNDGATPPTAVATTASVTTTGNNAVSISAPADGHAYLYGLTFNAGDSTGTASLNVGGGGSACFLKMEACNFYLLGTGSSSRINVGLAANTARGTFVNCQFRFSDAGQQFLVSANWRIHGGSFHASSTSPSSVLFQGNSNCVNLEVVGLDMSNLGNTLVLVNPGSSNPTGTYRFVGCKLPASWIGSLVGVTTPAPYTVVEMVDCDSGATNYRYWRETNQGSFKHSTSIYRDNGFTIDSTHIGWTLVSNANCKFPTIGLQSGWIIPKYNSTTGSPITATVEFATNNVTLKDDELVVEFFYLGASGAPLMTRISTEKASYVTTAANLSTSSETWTGVPGTPVKQKASATFTPQMAGLILARVTLYKASTTAYLDPLVTLT